MSSPIVKFPALPELCSKTREPFRKGVLIALENLLEDHASHDKLSLKGLIRQLEKNRPTVCGLERTTILQGSKWVYDTLIALMNDEAGEEVLGEDVEVILRQFEAWVERENEHSQGSEERL